MTKLSSEQFNGFLRDEYLFLQQQFEDYDKRTLTIKGWVSGGAIAALAFSLSKGYEDDPLLAVFVITISASIWVLEAFWKYFQYRFKERIIRLEAYFANPEHDPELAPFQIYCRWFESHTGLSDVADVELATGRTMTMTGNENNIIDGVKLFGQQLWRVLCGGFQPFVCLPYLPVIVLAVLLLANSTPDGGS